jgi:hypothetical protein
MLIPKDYGGVGFRGMRLFNQALLSHQDWRLIQYPNTLCAHLLKAKYYPFGSLIDTIFTGNGSSTWTAIEYGLQLLKQGVIWCVGNGSQIRAWRDPWMKRAINQERHREDADIDGLQTSSCRMENGIYKGYTRTLNRKTSPILSKSKPQTAMMQTSSLGSQIKEDCSQ